MKPIIFLIILFVITGCNNPKKEIVKKSYKEQIISKEINRSETELYDEKTGVYSNFKYLVSFKKPNGWDSDFGSGQYTLFRTYQRDSGYTMSMNVVETDLYPKKGFDAHDLFDKEGEQALIMTQIKAFESQGLSEPKNFKIKKTYLNNKPVMKQTYQVIQREEDFEIELTNTTYQFIKNGNIITLSLITPTFYLNENESYFYSFFDYFNFLPNKDKLINILK